MPKLTLDISDGFMRKVTTSAERLWPGQGTRGVLRLVRDAIRRYLRYSGDDSGNRNRS